MSIKPDWKNESDYPNPKTTSMGRWAWEFLRRNPKYRSDYQKYQNLPPYLKEFNSGHVVLPEGVDHKIDGDIFVPLFRGEKPKPNETFREYLARVPSASIGLPIGRISEKWNVGLTDGDHLEAPNPDDPDAQVHFGSDAWPGMHASGIDISEGGGDSGLQRLNLPEPYLEWSVPEPFSPQEIIVCFDTALPLGFQLKRAERNLRAIQKELRKRGLIQPVEKRTQNYPLYLRILDAIDAGTKESEIGKVFFGRVSNEYPDLPRNRAVRDALLAAKKLRDSDYIYLIPLSHLGKKASRGQPRRGNQEK